MNGLDASLLLAIGSPLVVGAALLLVVFSGKWLKPRTRNVVAWCLRAAISVAFLAEAGLDLTQHRWWTAALFGASAVGVAMSGVRVNRKAGEPSRQGEGLG
jgi:hypothetical protein